MRRCAFSAAARVRRSACVLWDRRERIQGSASQLERRQAMAMVSLAYLSCWHLTPSHIKATLTNFAKNSKWIVEE